jgi:hypothetical protein
MYEWGDYLMVQFLIIQLFNYSMVQLFNGTII